MELRVEIIGLCLLVPEPKHDRLHVLLPSTEGHAGHRPGAGVPKHVLDVKLRKIPPGFRMKGHVLDVTGGGASGPELELPDTLLRVDELAKQQLPAGQIGDAPDASVAARVTLPLRGTIVPPETVVNWRLTEEEGPGVPLMHKLTLIVPGVQPQGWSHRPLRRPGELPQQYAPDPDDDGVIRLTIKHTQVPEPIFKKDYPADHVEAYYRILGSGATGPTPYLNEEPPATVTGGGGHKSLEPPPPWGGTPFNCMLAQTDPPP
jgi:hypothetical protein